MSDPVLIALIAATQTVATVLINKLYGDRRAKETQRKVAAVDSKVDETHAQINGRMEQLIVASNSQGRQDQRAEDRQDARDAKAGM